MTTKDFFTTILKLFGLYALVISAFAMLPNFIVFGIQYFEWTSFLWTISATAILGFLFLGLLFKADSIVTKLKLDKGFDNNHISFENIKSDTILKLGSIIIGGSIFMQNIPPLITKSYMLFKSSVSSGGIMDVISGSSSEDLKVDVAINIISLILSYLLLTNYTRVSQFLLPQNEEK